MVKFYSLNVRGLNTPQKRNLTLNEAFKVKADILFYQETHFKKPNPPSFQNRKYPIAYHALSCTKSKGVSILVGTAIAFQLHQQLADPSGRYLMLICSINNQVYTLVNLYTPNENQIQFLTKTLTHLMQHRQGKCIVAGDFNNILNPILDISRLNMKQNNRDQVPARKFRELLHKFALTDVWRAKYPTEKEYTYYSPRHATYSRIDLILADPQTTTQTTKAWIGIQSWSDHAPIGIDIQPLPTQHIISRWRLNDSLIAHQDTQTYIKQEIESYFQTNTTEETNIQLTWLAHKATLRGTIIARASQLRKQRDQKVNELQTKIKLAQNKQHKHPSKTREQLIQIQKTELQQILLAKTEYRLKMLKQNYYTKGNKADKLLATQLGIKQAQTRIQYLTKQNHKITDPQQIVNQFAQYYNSLYNLKDSKTEPQPTTKLIHQYLSTLNFPQPSPTQRELLSAPITIEEITQAIKQLKLGKSPGPDSFTNIYYKTYQATLLPHLQKLFQNIMDTGKIHQEFLQAHISTIPKPGKSQDQCQNYRPIALLNTDLKIYSKILALRLNTVLPSLINYDQVGFVPGRQAPDNTRKLHNLLHIIKQQKIPALILSLDAEKTFDRIHWEYMNHTLQKFGLGTNFIKAISPLYSTPSAKVCTGGVLSNAFHLTNGTRQGCPLSPLIFALMVEPLAINLRQNPNIKGIPTRSGHHTIGLFADDIILLITDPQVTLPNIMTELKIFTKSPGTR
uniref:Reverse transcriptase domain-containing protein n=1 Tax=Xenopus tropicalis TaxID=8364 RepID=A0A803JQ02_XENTR